jgi:hypothetical protein
VQAHWTAAGSLHSNDGGDGGDRGDRDRTGRDQLGPERRTAPART